MAEEPKKTTTEQQPIEAEAEEAKKKRERQEKIEQMLADGNLFGALIAMFMGGDFGSKDNNSKGDEVVKEFVAQKLQISPDEVTLEHRAKVLVQGLESPEAFQELTNVILKGLKEVLPPDVYMKVEKIYNSPDFQNQRQELQQVANEYLRNNPQEGSIGAMSATMEHIETKVRRLENELGKDFGSDLLKEDRQNFKERVAGEALSAIDTNKDREISSNDAPTQQQKAAFMARVDQNKDGSVTKDEIAAALKNTDFKKGLDDILAGLGSIGIQVKDAPLAGMNVSASSSQAVGGTTEGKGR